MKKVFLIGYLTLMFITNSFSQGYNYNFCKEIITANKDYAVVTTFSVNHELTLSEIELLKNNLFTKRSVYAFNSNHKKTEIRIYHLSQVHFEDLKLLIINTGIELNFISTITTEFGHENTINSEIKR